MCFKGRNNPSEAAANRQVKDKIYWETQSLEVILLFFLTQQDKLLVTWQGKETKSRNKQRKGTARNNEVE